MYPLSRWTENFRKTMTLANMAAAEIVGTDFIGSEHFVWAFLAFPECEACKILTASGVTKENYESKFKAGTDPSYQGKGMTPNTQKMYDRAVDAAAQDGMLAGTAHMLYQILSVPTCQAVRFIGEAVEPFDKVRRRAFVESLLQNTESAINALVFRKHRGEDFSEPESKTDPLAMPDLSSASHTQENWKPSSVMVDKTEKPKGKVESNAQKLPDCGIDMTERARRGKMDPVIGRKKEIEKVVQVLSRRLKNNPVLVGEPGVGKSAIFE